MLVLIYKNNLDHLLSRRFSYYTTNIQKVLDVTKFLSKFILSLAMDDPQEQCKEH